MATASQSIAGPTVTIGSRHPDDEEARHRNSGFDLLYRKHQERGPDRGVPSSEPLTAGCLRKRYRYRLIATHRRSAIRPLELGLADSSLRAALPRMRITRVRYHHVGGDGARPIFN